MLRVALYSHDTCGLGHFRRCLKLAWALEQHFEELQGVFLTGSPWARRFPLPPGFSAICLEPVDKRGRGIYEPRSPGVPLHRLIDRRSRIIHDVLATWRPDLFVVDNVPPGLHGEVRQALEMIERPPKRVVLSLRDILDDPSTLRREWHQTGASATLDEHFDEIWQFGDAEDAALLSRQGPLGPGSPPLVACGRLGQHGPRQPETGEARERPAAGGAEPPKVLLTAGGGIDGAPLVETFLSATQRLSDLQRHVILGPDFPRSHRPGLAAGATVQRFVPGLERHLAEADLVISMAGYNTACEILASGVAAILVPRTRPRREQLIRARKLASRRRATCIHPDELDPGRLAAAIQRQLASPRRHPRETQWGGIVAAERAAELLGATPRSQVV